MAEERLAQFVDELETMFIQHENTVNGLAMSKYMKGRFSFYGIKAELRKAIQKSWLKTLPADLSRSARIELVMRLWEKEQREFQYVAIDWLNSWKISLIDRDDADFLKWLITNKSWWDSVDSIASNYLGKFALKFPDKMQEVLEEWRYESNRWLNRSCLIFQLKFREKADFELLKSLILQYLSVHEFFIQKAIGWSLRQYSKTNPDEVRLFLSEVSLKGVALKEASKYI